VSTGPSSEAQTQYQVRFDWGLEGAAAIAQGADVVVIVDVLSFSTTVDVATRHGLAVMPVLPDEVTEVAERLGAVVAGRRGDAISLSPASFTPETVAGVERVVLTSLNGATIARSMAGRSAAIVAGSLRNRRAVADWALDRQGDLGDRFTIAVVAAGERRDDGSMRFAVEDLLGAGALIDALADVGIDYCSPEAAAAAAAFTGLKNATGHLIGASASGRELAEAGFRADVDLAIEIDSSLGVPVLGEFGFRA
jgi:2-phosphosulfolactate phosphatase